MKTPEKKTRYTMSKQVRDQLILLGIDLGIPYRTLIKKLINLDVLPIPVDFLPLHEENIFDDYNMMYWPNGQKILAASRIIARDQRLHAVYLSNFRCGPDSFILHYVRDEMKGKPYLQLEVDEHSADAGMITRCEAFLDSLQGKHPMAKERKERPAVSIIKAAPSKTRTLYFPYMCDSAYILAAASRHCGIDSQVLPMQDAVDLKLGREHTSSRECFPMICTTGSFLKKLAEPGFDPGKSGFFMPSHNGPCRFGQYHKLQRIIFERLGYGDAEIISPNNKHSYADFAEGQGVRFRLVAWKGAIAADILGKYRQERRPYEKNEGDIDRVYQTYLDKLVRCVENGAWGIKPILREAEKAFNDIPLTSDSRKPIVAIVGEIFMRDNPYCSGYLVQKLRQLGAETLMAPVREWISYSTVRFTRDSIWRGEFGGVLKSYGQGFAQNLIGHGIESAAHRGVELERDIPVRNMLSYCNPYIHKDYDGDPPLAFGMAAGLAETGISGVANILPFTCLPGTLITSISSAFRKDNSQIPWVDIAYDGQEDTAIDTRLQAFVFQAKEFAKKMGYDAPRKWSHN